MAEPEIVYAIRHLPGPNWQDGVKMSEQTGFDQHVAHYRAWQAQGKLMLGGPFITEGTGGMTIAAVGLSEEEVTAYANADPAVVSGLLICEIFPWMLAMRRG